MVKTSEITFIVNNKEKQLEEVFKALHAPLYFYAVKFVQNNEVAKDMVQDAFLGLLDTVGKANISNVKSYLYQAVRNNCLNYIKHTYIENSFAEFEKQRAEREIAFYDSHQTLVEKELHQQLSEAIAKLPKKYETVFRMSRYEGLKNKEIAEKLGISVRTVETQIHRALVYLRKSLANQSINLFVLFFTNKKHFF